MQMRRGRHQIPAGSLLQGKNTDGSMEERDETSEGVAGEGRNHEDRCLSKKNLWIEMMRGPSIGNGLLGGDGNGHDISRYTLE
jgi:hypothetical protein